LEVLRGKGPFGVKNRAPQVFSECQLTGFIGIETQAMTIVDLVDVQSELVGGKLSADPVPAVGQQHISDVDEECPDG
jgi:hypothetical protein